MVFKRISVVSSNIKENKKLKDNTFIVSKKESLSKLDKLSTSIFV